jgi:hypothetical protein
MLKMTGDEWEEFQGSFWISSGWGEPEVLNQEERMENSIDCGAKRDYMKADTLDSSIRNTSLPRLCTIFWRLPGLWKPYCCVYQQASHHAMPPLLSEYKICCTVAQSHVFIDVGMLQ